MRYYVTFLYKCYFMTFYICGLTIVSNILLSVKPSSVFLYLVSLTNIKRITTYIKRYTEKFLSVLKVTNNNNKASFKITAKKCYVFRTEI